MGKRFQECNWLEKVWRYRFYIFIPFKYIWYICIKDTNNLKGKNLWKLLVGIAQCDMNWTYTSEEVFAKLSRDGKED
jgi:hypothetical protein